MAKEFVTKLLDSAESPNDIMVAVNALTVPDEDVDLNADPPTDFGVVLVEHVGMDYKPVSPGTVCRALFVRVMAELVYVGNPATLRVEWDDLPQLAPTTDSAGVALAVVGHEAFNTRRAPPVDTIERLMLALQDSGYEDKGVTRIWALQQERKAVKLVTPYANWSCEALYVAIMLELYDRGDDPELLSVTWGVEPYVTLKRAIVGESQEWEAGATLLVEDRLLT